MTKILTDVLPITENAASTVVLVFFALCALFFLLAIIWLVASLAEKMHRTGKASDETASDLPIPSVTVADDNEIIAAISAAIAVILQEEAAAKGTAYNGFRIVSFKRATKGRAWTQNNK